MISRRTRVWALLLGLLLLAGSALLGRGERAAAPQNLTTRLLGPLGETAAAVQWVRVERSIAAGDVARAFEVAESALALAPQSTEGWATLVATQGFELASTERESDTARRARWIESALASVERGLLSARDPAALALLGGEILYVQSETEPPPDWPGGREGLLRDAKAWFARAAELGSTSAREFLIALE